MQPRCACTSWASHSFVYALCVLQLQLHANPACLQQMPSVGWPTNVWLTSGPQACESWRCQLDGRVIDGVQLGVSISWLIRLKKQSTCVVPSMLFARCRCAGDSLVPIPDCVGLGGGLKHDFCHSRGEFQKWVFVFESVQPRLPIHDPTGRSCTCWCAQQ